MNHFLLPHTQDNRTQDDSGPSETEPGEFDRSLPHQRTPVIESGEHKLDGAPQEAEEFGPRQPGQEEPGPEEARSWRFDHAAGSKARPRQLPPGAGSSGTDRALVQSGYDWDERTSEPPGWNVLGFLWRRKLRIGLVAGIAMTCLTLATYLAPESYRASSAVIFEGDHPGAIRDDDGQREPAFAADTLSNELELLTSEEVLNKVVMTLDLTHNQEFDIRRRIMPEQAAAIIESARAWVWQLRARWSSGRPPGPAFARPAVANPDGGRLMATVDLLRKRLTIAPVGLSRVIHITAQSQDPEFAATLANTVAVAYASNRADTKAAATREAHEWIERRLNTLHERALRSARAYDAFRHDSGAVRGKDGNISQEQVSQVSNELTQAQGLRSTLQLALAQATGSGETDLDALTSASGSPLLQRLREQLAAATARRAELSVTGGAALPSVVANRSQIADITRSIARERNRIRETLQSRIAVSVSNEMRLGAALDALKARVEKADASGAQVQALEREANADAETYRNFVTRAEQTDPELAYQPPSVRLLSRAVVPLVAASPNKRVILPAALLLSLGAGIAAALSKERARRGVFSLRDLPRPEGQAPLGLLPWVRRRDLLRRKAKMTRVWEEAVAQVLARMLQPYRGLPPASILVTSAVPREGKTRVAIALATAARNRGLRVLLIDADLRYRALSKAAGLGRSDVTLARLLEGQIDVHEAAVHHDGWGFAVLPAGEPDTSPINLLATDAWENALRDLECVFDLVIVDTPPVLAVGDTWLMARYADATAVVAEWGTTPGPTIELAVEQLSTAHARVLGLVLTKVDPREHASHGYDDSVMFSRDLLRYHGSRKLL